MSSYLFAFALSSQTIVILLVLGVLLFGRRLPEVGQSLGKSLSEFKKGMNGVEDEITQAVMRPSQAQLALESPRPAEYLPASPHEGETPTSDAAAPPPSV